MLKLIICAQKSEGGEQLEIALLLIKAYEDEYYTVQEIATLT